MRYWIIPPIVGFLSAFLIVFSQKGEEINCYPYLERIEVLKAETLKKLKTDPEGALKELDARLKVLNQIKLLK